MMRTSTLRVVVTALFLITSIIHHNLSPEVHKDISVQCDPAADFIMELDRHQAEMDHLMWESHARQMLGDGNGATQSKYSKRMNNVRPDALLKPDSPTVTLPGKSERPSKPAFNNAAPNTPSLVESPKSDQGNWNILQARKAQEAERREKAALSKPDSPEMALHDSSIHKQAPTTPSPIESPESDHGNWEMLQARKAREERAKAETVDTDLNEKTRREDPKGKAEVQRSADPAVSPTSTTSSKSFGGDYKKLAEWQAQEKARQAAV